MATNLKATRILLIDAALILLISVVLVVTNLVFLDRINHALTRIDAARVRKLALVGQMTQIIRNRSIVMLTMSTERDLWALETENRKFHKLADEFIQARNQLEKMGLPRSESQALHTALSRIVITQQLQDGIVERIRDGDYRNVESDIVRKDFPLEFRLLGSMEVLYDRVVERANREREAVNAGYRRAMMWIGTVSFGFILVLLLLVWRSLSRIRKIETGLIQKTENLGWDATHDPLTNVFNRRWLQYKIEFLLDTVHGNRGEHSLLYLDLDGFKQVNDRFGHIAGDHYLVALCREVEHTIRHNDTFCRMGGDEFAVLLEGCRKETAIGIAQDLADRIGRFFLKYEGHDLHTTCSIGLCHFTGEEVQFDDLVRRADELCYEAKHHGRNGVVIGGYEGREELLKESQRGRG